MMSFDLPLTVMSSLRFDAIVTHRSMAHQVQYELHQNYFALILVVDLSSELLSSELLVFSVLVSCMINNYGKKDTKYELQYTDS
jgi:hypothetical protein